MFAKGLAQLPTRRSTRLRGTVRRNGLELASIDTVTGRGTVLSEWFPFIPTGSMKGKVCREEAIRLGNFGVLTLLEIC